MGMWLQYVKQYKKSQVTVISNHAKLSELLCAFTPPVKQETNYFLISLDHSDNK